MKKKRINLTALLLFLALAPMAQAQMKGFAFGIKGGVNLSRLTMGDVFTTRYDDNGNPYLGFDGKEVKDNLKQSFDTRTGGVGGIYVRFGKTLFVQPELLVSTKGGSFDIIRNDNDNPTTQKVNIKYSNIDVPLLIGLKGGPFRVLAGPVTSFRIGDNQKLSEALREYSSNFNDALAEATFGYQVGVGLDIGNFSLDVRNEGSFTNLASFQVNGAPVNGGTTVRQKINSWQVTLGIKLL
ncbi:porin family protein [Dyadobacter tibetensis]|uniref:porin family protein n=1 Tax=Dyadobacter tibetensis TaxID=1211851 RepID=UPI0005C5ECB9|nr:porin family protein [Dyadobacter tibetensis]